MSLAKKFLLPFKLFFSAILCLLLAIVLLTTWAPFTLLRLTVQLLAKLFRKDLNEILKPASALLAHKDLFAKSEFNLLICSFYDNQITIQLARQKLIERIFGSLITNPRLDFPYEHLRNSITTFLNFFFWKKQKDFDIQHHVRTYEDVLEEDFAQPSLHKLPVRQLYTDDDLKNITSILVSKPWKPNRSPWEIILLKNYSKDGSSSVGPDGATTNLQTVFIYRFHHCIADGYSILNLIIKSNNYQEGEITALPSFKKSNTCLKLVSPLLLPFKAFLDLTIFLAKQNFGSNGWTQDLANPQSSTYSSTWTSPIPLERIKRLKNKYQVSFLAVLQGVSTGAFRKMMLASGASVPHKVSCLIPFPLPNHRLGLRIHTATAVLHLPTGQEDPVERVMKCQKTFLQERRSVAPLLLLKIFTCISRMPNFIASKVFIPFITVGMSPFPGVTSPMYFTPENQSTRIFFTVGLFPGCSAAANITTLSSFDNIIFTFTCRNSLDLTRKQLEEFNFIIQDEISALEHALGNKLDV